MDYFVHKDIRMRVVDNNNNNMMKTCTSSNTISSLEIDTGGAAAVAVAGEADESDGDDDGAIPAHNNNCTNPHHHQHHHQHSPSSSPKPTNINDADDDSHCCPWLLGRLSSYPTTSSDYTLLQSFHEQEDDSISRRSSTAALSAVSPSAPPPPPPPYALLFYYFFHGIQSNLPETALYFVLKDNFQLKPGDYSYISSLLWMPWALKPVFAYISDIFPIRGKRRTPYMTIGLCTSSIGWYLVSWWSFSPTGVITSFIFYTYLIALVIISIASVVAETAADSLLAELVKKEDDMEIFGWLQSTIWTMDSAGSVIGAMIPIIAFSYDVSPETLLSWNAGLVSISALTVCFIQEAPYHECCQPPPTDYHQQQQVDVNSLPDQEDTVLSSSLENTNKITATPILPPPPHRGPIQDIYYHLYQNPVLVKALVFVFLVSSSPTSGDAFTYYQTDILNFSPAFLSWTTVIQTMANFLAAWAYAAFLRTWNMRHVFSAAIVSCMLIGLSNIVVVQRWNVAWGVSDKCFIVGDTLAQGVAGQIVFMPVAVLAAHLAPVGPEGTFYALTMSVLNIAWALSQFLSGVFANLFQVTSPDHYEHLTALMMTVGALTLLPLLFLNLVPKISDMQCSNTFLHDKEEATESPNSVSRNILLLCRRKNPERAVVVRHLAVATTQIVEMDSTCKKDQ